MIDIIERNHAPVNFLCVKEEEYMLAEKRGRQINIELVIER